MKQLEETREKGHHLLLGVTGGIATGKSLVAQMLKDLGAHTIDFDLLSRFVVEPDKPAWNEMVAYFGEEILQKDRTLNRKYLGEIIFSDTEKRKRLEGFTHPRIQEEFFKLAQEYSARDPSAIIQAIVPLLFEVHLGYLFHKILLVYAPEELQIRRLIERDRISREMAIKIIQSQMPIEEKKGYADFIVDNSGSPEATRRQVEEIWKKLKAIQKEQDSP